MHWGQFRNTSISVNNKYRYFFSDSKTMATLVNYTCKSFLKLTPGFSRMLLGACLQGGGGPQVGEVTRLGGVKN